MRRSFKYRLDVQDTVALLYVLEDASYWRYLEYGTVYIPAGPFIAPNLLLVENLLREAVRDFFNQFVIAGFGGLAYG